MNAASTHIIRSDCYGFFAEKFAKLARKADKLGVRKPRATIVERFEMVVGNDALGRNVSAPFYRVEIDADPVKVEGYTFGATIDHQSQGGNIVRSMPGVDFDIPERLRSAPSFCDHCNSLRQRRYTYALRCDATGEFKQIGNNCLADFIGHNAADLIARAQWAGTLGGDSDDDFDGAYGMRNDATLDLVAVLEHTAAMIRVYGWVAASAAKADESLTSTRSRVRENMFPRKCPKTGRYEKTEPVTDADKALAAEALAWAAALETKGRLSEYESNVLAVAKSTFIADRSAGIAASIVSSCLREQEKLRIARKEQVDTAGSQYVGKDGERIHFGKVRVIKAYSGPSGDFFVHRYEFATATGDVLRWSASSGQGLVKGEEVMLTGTVKGHDEWQGQKRTRINRCKVAALTA